MPYCGGMSKLALGKGLGALIAPRIAAPQPVVEAGESVQQIPLEAIVASPLQPRTEFRGEGLEELTESIREHGIIQPLIVRQRAGRYELIAGERRWRAAKALGLKNAPVIVREAGDQEVLEVALIENIQREDLNPVEEALAYERLARDFHLRQEDIARKVGKSRAAVANSIRLLDLAPQVREWLAAGELSVGHAKVLLGAKQPEEQVRLGEVVLKQGLTVRATERLLASHQAGGETAAGRAGARAKGPKTPPAILKMQTQLSRHLAAPVVFHHGEKRGKIELEYHGAEDLQRLLRLLGLKTDS